MIAATGALVSVIALDETILLNFKQQQDFDYHKIPFAIGNNWVYFYLLY
jgi:CIC family chloride channel protein